MYTIPRHTLVDVLDRIETDPGALRDAYSGRGMYGDTCIGVDLDNMSQLLGFMATLGYVAGDNDDQHLMDMAGYAQTDNMGTGVIVYFPRWQFA